MTMFLIDRNNIILYNTSLDSFRIIHIKNCFLLTVNRARFIYKYVEMFCLLSATIRIERMRVSALPNIKEYYFIKRNAYLIFD